MKLKYVGLLESDDLIHGVVDGTTRRSKKPLGVIYTGYTATFKIATSDSDHSYIGEMKLNFRYVPMLEFGDWYDWSFIEELL